MIAATTIRILLRSIAEALPIQWRSPCGPRIPDCYSGPGIRRASTEVFSDTPSGAGARETLPDSPPERSTDGNT